MLVLGVDPGYHRMGLAVVKKEGNHITLVASSILETDSSLPLPLRLRDVHTAMLAAIGEHKPEAIAVEELYFSRNIKTAIGVAEARGVILLAAAEKNLPVFEYKPVQVKQTLTNNGQAGKDQVAFIVKRLLGAGTEAMLDDEVDAIAVALCHAFHHRKGDGA